MCATDYRNPKTLFCLPVCLRARSSWGCKDLVLFAYVTAAKPTSWDSCRVHSWEWTNWGHCGSDPQTLPKFWFWPRNGEMKRRGFLCGKSSFKNKYLFYRLVVPIHLHLSDPSPCRLRCPPPPVALAASRCGVNLNDGHGASVPRCNLRPPEHGNGCSGVHAAPIRARRSTRGSYGGGLLSCTIRDQT